jgi:hypothetical protein
MTRRTNATSNLAAAAAVAALMAFAVATPSLAFESNGIGPFYYPPKPGSVRDYYSGYTSKTYDSGFASTRTVPAAYIWQEDMESTDGDRC